MASKTEWWSFKSTISQRHVLAEVGSLTTLGWSVFAARHTMYIYKLNCCCGGASLSLLCVLMARKSWIYRQNDATTATAATGAPALSRRMRLGKGGGESTCCGDRYGAPMQAFTYLPGDRTTTYGRLAIGMRKRNAKLQVTTWLFPAHIYCFPDVCWFFLCFSAVFATLQFWAQTNANCEKFMNNEWQKQKQSGNKIVMCKGNVA